MGRFLEDYYLHKFPWDQLAELLGEDTIPRRIFAFDLKDRKQGFKNIEEVKTYAVVKSPGRIDVDGVYDAEFKNVIYRELLIDLDATDYDTIREKLCPKCCKERHLCPLCWALIVASARIIVRMLRLAFKFEKISVFHTGGRGVHIWVTDRLPDKFRHTSECLMDASARQQVAELLAKCTSIPYYRKHFLIPEDSIIPAVLRERGITLDDCAPQIDMRVVTQPRHLIRLPWSFRTDKNRSVQLIDIWDNAILENTLFFNAS